MSQDILKRIQKARYPRAFFCFLVLLIFCACTTLESRFRTRDEIIQTAGLQTQILHTQPFPLFAAKNKTAQNTDVLTIVIEGDGYSWVSRYKLSDNPTPNNPIGLRIAAGLNKPAIYLARPCQYVTASNCNPSLWSYDRFHDDVISSYMDALDQIEAAYGKSDFDIIGFSGGAYIALALSAQRKDIKNVTTIAGVLDPDAWTNFHKISPLAINRSPETLLSSSTNTDFKHMCSHNDDVVPCTLTQKFIKDIRKLNLSNHKIEAFREETHNALWTKL